MKLLKVFSYLSLALAVLLSLSACVKQPTITATEADDRPILVFRLANNATKADGYQVLVDDLPMGSVADFQSGDAGLKVLPGSHLVKILKQGELIHSEKIYVSDGTTKEILIH